MYQGHEERRTHFWHMSPYFIVISAKSLMVIALLSWNRIGVRETPSNGGTKTRRTTDTNERPMASRILLFASSECRTTLGGGKAGISSGGEALREAAALAVGTGTGRIRLGGAGESVFWRRRTEGFITEFERMRVPYWCWGGCAGVG